MSDECVDFCSLPSDQLAARVKEIRRVVAPRIRSRQSGTKTLVWVFDGDPETRAIVDSFVALERRCCSSTTFEVTAAAADGRLRLTISGDATSAFAAL